GGLDPGGGVVACRQGERGGGTADQGATRDREPAGARGPDPILLHRSSSRRRAGERDEVYEVTPGSARRGESRRVSSADRPRRAPAAHRPMSAITSSSSAGSITSIG